MAIIFCIIHIPKHPIIHTKFLFLLFFSLYFQVIITSNLNVFISWFQNNYMDLLKDYQLFNHCLNRYDKLVILQFHIEFLFISSQFNREIQDNFIMDHLFVISKYHKHVILDSQI